MASIVENIIGNKAIQLGAEEFVRKMNFGNGWTWMRVGIYFRVMGTSTILHKPRLQIGLNIGDQDTFTSNNCAGYGGTAIGYNADNTWTYDGVNRRYSRTIYTNWCVQKTGATITDTIIGGTNATGYIASADSAGPSIYVGHFLRTGVGAYTVGGNYMTLANFTAFPTYYNFMQVMEADSDVGTYTTGSVNNQNMTGLGNLDTLSIYWNRNVPVIEIYSVIAAAYY
jgi:hypothetical protein